MLRRDPRLGARCLERMPRATKAQGGVAPGYDADYLHTRHLRTVAVSEACELTLTYILGLPAVAQPSGTTGPRPRRPLTSIVTSRRTAQ